MLIYSLIPARSGSKGIKNKNIKIIKGHPLIYYTIKFSIKCSFVNKTFVSTDSKKIQSLSLKYGALCPFLRPKKISQDNSTDIECFKHFIYFLKKNKIKLPDYILHLRATSPMRKYKQLEAAYSNIIKHKPDSLRFIKEVPISAYKLWKVKGNFIEPFVKTKKELHSMGRQYLEKTYLHSGTGDFIKSSVIMKGSMVGKKTAYIIDKNKNYIDIDIPKDLSIFRKIIKN